MMIGVAAVVAFGVVVLIPGGQSGLGFWIAVAVLAATTAVAVAAFGVAAGQSSERLRKPRMMLTVGLAIALVAGLLEAFTGGPTAPSGSFPRVSDLLFAVCVPFLVWGLVSYPFAKETIGRRFHALLDGAIAATGIWIVVYSLLLIPTTSATGSPSLDELAIVAYPALATFVLGVVVSVLLRVPAELRRELGLFSLGIGLIWVQVILAAVLAAGPNDSVSGVLAIVSEVGYVCLALAGWVAIRQRPTAAEEPQNAADNSWNRWLPVLPASTVGLALLVGVVTAVQGGSITAVGFDSGIILIMLLLAEQLLSNRELGMLNADLKKSGELFESLVTGSSDLITLHNPDGTLRYASPAVYRLLNLSAKDVLGHKLTDFVHPDDLAKLDEVKSQLMETAGATAQLDLRIGHCPEGMTEPADINSLPWRWVEAVASNMLEDPSVGGIVANTRDIHEQQLLRQRLSYEAYHDPLTGLGNLALARRIFAEQCYGPDRAPVTMILADLDGFKTINDTFGHAFGDDVLVAVARRIRLSVEDEDQIARIGGDEFVFILDSEHDADQAAADILNAIKRPFLVQGTTVNVSASLGIARSIDASDSVELLRNADLAMYSAKSAGGSKAFWYDTSMHEETAYRLRVQDGLRRALDEDAFELHYQPVVALPGGHVVGAEALIRWNDRILGRMFPDVFIPIAESSGLSAEIDQWVVRQACAQLRQWWDAGVQIPQISVNVSRRQLTGEFTAIVRSAMEDNRVPPRGICIEVTESAVAGDMTQAREALVALRELGVAIALDDFGTGESSLSQLASLPIDRVKIDKSFVMPSSADSDALALLESIIGVCRTIGKPIVAEGVEDTTAVANLSRMGVDYAQGYHYFKPMPAGDVRDQIAARIPVPRGSDESTPVVEPAVEQPIEAEPAFDNVVYRRFGA